MAPRTDLPETLRKLFAYCRANGWAGYDPYDALNSRLLEAVPFLQSRVPRILVTQALKRSPVNLRPLLRIPQTQNPKGLALLLAALLKAPGVIPDEDELQRTLVERLVSLRSPGTSYWCWGYSFPWQTRSVVVPRGAANLVCTTFVAQALLDLYEARPQAEYLAMAVSAAGYLLDALYWERGDTEAGFGYPLPEVREQIHNANFLAAALLCRVGHLTGDAKFVEPALRVTRWSAGRQRADGSWSYGETASKQWIDNFHTGYNLCALRSIAQYSGSAEFDNRLARGFKFYRDHFFREDGAARYFHDRTYPIDVHSVAQSIVTLVQLQDLDPESLHLANEVANWATRHLWDRRGYFYYRAHRFGTVKTSYMRWSQAWMCLGLAELIGAERNAAEGLRRRYSAAVVQA